MAVDEETKSEVSSCAPDQISKCAVIGSINVPDAALYFYERQFAAVNFPARGNNARDCAQARGDARRSSISVIRQRSVKHRRV